MVPNRAGSSRRRAAHTASPTGTDRTGSPRNETGERRTFAAAAGGRSRRRSSSFSDVEEPPGHEHSLPLNRVQAGVTMNSCSGKHGPSTLHAKAPMAPAARNVSQDSRGSLSAAYAAGREVTSLDQVKEKDY